MADLGVGRHRRPALPRTHWPIQYAGEEVVGSRKVMSAASAGSSGVSSAMTSGPASVPCCTGSTIPAGVEAVIRMPLAPLAMHASMAWNLASWSPSPDRR